MNEGIILGMVRPYIKDSTLTYHEFEGIFDMLSLKEQYAVIEVLEKNQIELVDGNTESEVLDDILTSDDFFDESDDVAILYDDSLFSEKSAEKGFENKTKGIEFPIDRKQIRLSNRTLIKMIQEGSAQAKQDLCIKNQGLVKMVVSEYYRAFFNKLDFEDLEQAGMAGMIKAAKKFDFSKETEFSTYAMWWIRQAVLREIQDYGYTIRIPVHKIEKIQKVYKLNTKYKEEKNYYKRIEKISADSQLSIEAVEDCLRLFNQFIKPRSLDELAGEDENTPIGELIPITKDPSVEDIVLRRMLRLQLDQVLKTLSPKEQEIIRLRFGMDGGREHTLEEIGQSFGVTRERIRQIEEKALKKLRHPSKSKRFRDFLNM